MNGYEPNGGAGGPSGGEGGYGSFRRAVLEKLKDTSKKRALLYIKCERFNEFNDNVGVAFTRRVTDEFGKRVEVTRREGEDDLAYRFYSDVFLFVTTYDDIGDLTGRIDKEYADFKKWNAEIAPDVLLTLRCGVYLIPKGDFDVDGMVEFANIARVNSAENGYMIFNDSMRAKNTREKEMEGLMKAALENDEFSVYLQPKLDIHTKKVVGAEALMRWHSPAEKIMPAEFVPLFEKNGFIPRMDHYMAEHVFRALHEWTMAGKPVVPVSMNVSDESIKNRGFAEKLRTLGEAYRIPPRMIEMEIRESMFDRDAARLMEVINTLRKMGVTFAVDNFGTGPISLSAIHNLPIDVLKISADFFGHRHLSERERAMLTHMVRMAKSLDMKVLYQGVESEEQEELLKSVGCDYVQGFLYAYPMTPEAFQRYLKQANG